MRRVPKAARRTAEDVKKSIKPYKDPKAPKAPKRPPKSNPSIPIGNKCFFFKLSAELRNEIYELALVKSGTAKITKENFAQPGLLRTCCRIRAEAIKIYYMQNTFSIRIDRLDASLLHSFYMQHPDTLWLQQNGGRGMHVESGWNTTDACWPHFLQWVKWYYDGEILAIVCPKECTVGLCCTLNSAFCLVDEMRKHDWQQIVSVLEIFKKVMLAQRGRQPRWIESP
ncbi:hypothetical protein CKM354_001150200 [Cercospora kikuchii]|uniref:Uncharacterized protein n=1 Tax=Cercospora kikuchii TaxID=84275 RepID=A0A9P3CVM6_9PEZI|nr:uncharacterized protein CKM354_001150200 [Cercospora kikuchii]GIZ48442.1 hypothetical protein CKM354_001150200 [Cercospora kikuchii]